MEGIAGIVDPEDIGPGQAEYERNRKLITAETNAAVRGVYAHDPGAQVLVSMMSGLAGDVGAVVFIGYHGKAGTPCSVLSHTMSGRVIADVRCDGRSLGELGLNTAPAAHSGVPAVVVKRALGIRATGDSIPGLRRSAGCSGA